MTKLTFPAAYGEETRTVEISSPFGGGGSFNIMQTLSGHEGMFVIGKVVHTSLGWDVESTAFYAFDKSHGEIAKDIEFDRIPLTMDDKQAILDRLVEAGMIEPDEVVNRW